jgi:hypothetical protein
MCSHIPGHSYEAIHPQELHCLVVYEDWRIDVVVKTGSAAMELIYFLRAEEIEEVFASEHKGMKETKCYDQLPTIPMLVMYSSR